MLIQAPDRRQLTLPRDEAPVAELIASMPGDVDLVLLETHTSEAYPTILSCALEAERGEEVIGRWAFGGADMAAAGMAPRLAKLVPTDRGLDHALRAAMRVHGGHACAGLVLGTRLALTGAAALGVAVPDTRKQLLVTAETDRCAVDAIQSVTGCRPGKRTLRLLDYGKLAATFIDQWSGTAVRVAARGDLRERVGDAPEGVDRHEHQRRAYLAMTPSELFTVSEADASVAQMDLPGPPRRRVLCAACGEEVSDGRDVATESGPLCRPCAAPGAGATPPSGGRPC
jgi:formylmethanofuran dehydrogenase subunit E